MMFADRRLRAIAACVCLAATGCSSMREIPRGEYAASAERKRVEVLTREGLYYKFDFARFGTDTLTGYRQRDVPGDFEEYSTFAIPLEGVERLSERRTSWLRTGLAGGAVLGGIVGIALARRKPSTPAGQDTTDLPPIP